MAAEARVRTVKSLFGVFGALLPVLYCGGLVLYFSDVGGSPEGIAQVGLGPTVIGLGAVGALFCIPLMLKLVKVFMGPKTSGSGGSNARRAQAPESSFDADAVISRYLAQNPNEATRDAPQAGPRQAAAPAQRSGFGRRTA